MGNIFYLDKSNILIINTKSNKSNKPIKNVHPRIKKIVFSSQFAGNPKLLLDNNLMIETIDLSKKLYYSEELENLPPKLKNLYLNNGYNKIIKNFPQNLKILHCSDDFYFINQEKIPNTIEKLKLSESSIISNIDYSSKSLFLSENLEELKFNYDDSYEPEKEYLEYLIKLFDNLPDNLKVLVVPNFWNFPLKNLPLRLEKLYLGIEFNQELDSLPESIRFVEFAEQCNFNKPLDNLPSQLEYLNLQFQNKYNNTISNLPNSIKYLELGEYDLIIERLPKQMTELHIASPIQFTPVEYEKINNITPSSNTSKKIQYYKLGKIGKHNIKNNILIEIPKKLSKIVYWDELSVHKYYKSSEIDLWYYDEN